MRPPAVSTPLTVWPALAAAFFGGALAIWALLPPAACGAEVCPPGEAPKPKAGYQAATFDDLPGWKTDDHAAAFAAFRGSCVRIAGDPSRFVGTTFGRAEDWSAACREAAKTKPAEARLFFETWFEPARVTGDGEPRGRVTGYYEPELTGSRTPSGKFPAPVYAVPADLVTVDPVAFASILGGERLSGKVVDGLLVPYDTRAEIAAGSVAGRLKPILYLPSEADSFFLQIQGSGRVALAGGGGVRLGYGAQNGHPYVAIGSVLIERGEVAKADMSMQAIRAWLAAHPDEAQGLMNLNPSYVFFNESEMGDPALGPRGAEYVQLTAGRSLAVDDRIYPYGLPIFVSAEIAGADGKTREAMNRLMVAQDTGGAIRGVVRGDIFFGWGAEAEARAGATDGAATFYVLRARNMTGTPQ